MFLWASGQLVSKEKKKKSKHQNLGFRRRRRQEGRVKLAYLITPSDFP